MHPISQTISTETDPDTDRLVSEAIARSRSAGAPRPERVRLRCPWRPREAAELEISYQVRAGAGGESLSATVVTDGGRTELSLDDPLRLLPVEIGKPWGREIWYSGMERRGESRVQGTGGALDFGTYLALAPERICQRRLPVLLKILDPLPQPVLGELYLEVHEEKREVYVVTRVDPAAWPDGRGRMRYGMNRAHLETFASDEDGRNAFLAAIRRYEDVRRAVDAGESGRAEEEQAARNATLEFTGERELSIGDVVYVPTWVPHSLQNGVRVVEFQTPTYERHIISSTQKVLTQEGWDSERAIAGMRLDTPEDPRPEPVADGVERIARFEDFAVWRASLTREQTFALPAHIPYALVLCVTGALSLAGPSGSLALDAGEAAFVPAGAVGRSVLCTGAGISLAAAPGL